MKRNKLCILPKLNDCGGDTAKQWFIYFSYRNPLIGKMTRFKIYDGFSAHHTKKAKYVHAEKLCDNYANKLKTGWDPFADDTEVIYDDQLAYQSIAKIYGIKRKSNKTFAYFASKYLEELKGYRIKTYNNYKSKYRIFNEWLQKNGIGGNDISTINEIITKDFFKFLINDLKLARITIKKYEAMLSRLFLWMVDQRYIKKSPIGNIPECTRENDQAARPVNENDIDKLVEEIKHDSQLWLTIQLEYYCFLRPGLEIRFSKIKWFDLARGRITIPKTVIKTNRDKVVIIPKQFRKYLLTEWKLHLFPPDYYVIGKNGIPGPNPLGSNNLRNRFNIIRDALELPKEYKLYSWKHTGNARAEDAGIPMFARQHQNGHKSMRSTEVYLKNKIGFKSVELEDNFPTL